MKQYTKLNRRRGINGVCRRGGLPRLASPANALFLCLIGWTSQPTVLHAAEPAFKLTIDAGTPGPRINPAMWGVFFEDINSGADGGLYAELVKNRSFEFSEPLMGWTKVEEAGASGSLSIGDQFPLNPANPHYLHVQVEKVGAGFGLANEGFGGMGVREGETYHFTVQARTTGTAPQGLRVELVTADGRSLGTATVSKFGSQWKSQSASFRASATDPKARLVLTVQGAGTLDLDMVSLFPSRTWKNRPQGLRADLVQMLAEMKPGFVRFPGGCIVEGHYLTNRYQWKNTIGNPTERRLIMNRWNDEFKHRPAPDYFQTFGLGFFEYFQMCEDIGATPLPILNCGMACQFNSGELAPLDQLDPYLQDALDLIEFANGPPTSPWGRRRAELGHPKPFQLKLLGVGNEQWGPQYIERFTMFAKALKAKHPDVQLISSVGPSPDDERFKFLSSRLGELHADIVDEHCYATPDWFFNNVGRYDARPRSGPKVFMGEYAAQSVKVVSPDNRNDLRCALAEAAYMTGLERNADAVVMASYAPLFGHVDRWQWKPNLIWFDNLRVFGTPNYYVQQLFSRNRGDVAVPVRLTSPARSSADSPRVYASASRDQRAGEIILKVVNPSAEPAEVAVELTGAKRVAAKGKRIVLAGGQLEDENSLEVPRKVAPMEQTARGLGAQFRETFKPYSLTVLRIPVGVH